MINSITYKKSYSNANSVDLSKYTTVSATYYSPPILDKFICPKVEGLTKEQKIKSIEAYIVQVNRWFGQINHNIRAAKKDGLKELEEAYQRHYNYHIAQRSLAQRCISMIKYDGNTASVGTFSFPEPAPKPVQAPAPKPVQTPEPTLPVQKPIKVGINEILVDDDFCKRNPEDPKCKSGVEVFLKNKEIKKESKFSKDLIIGILVGIVLYVVVLKK
tara:strand:- start:2399 stop:3046 length:648 start_codon:yes stop_codon:yes gene_type:complete